MEKAMVFACRILDRADRGVRAHVPIEIMGAGRRIADRSHRRSLGERAHGAVGANAGADIDAARDHRLHGLAAPLREEEVEDEAMLLEDAGLLAERRRLVLPVVRRPDRELELILRLCAPRDART